MRVALVDLLDARVASVVILDARVALVVMLGACSFDSGFPGAARGPDAATSDAAIPDAPALVGDAPMSPDGSTNATCPMGYMASSTGVYRKVSTPASWLEAEQDCEDDANSTTLHTHLVVIDDAAENAALASSTSAWLGATDLPNEDMLAYVTLQPATYTQSLTGNAGNKDCVRIRDDGAFLARDCNEANAYVCECDAFAASASRYPNPPDGN